MLKTNFKKVMHIFLCLTLVFAFTFNLAISANAAGPETWDQSRGPVEDMRIVNDNTTPIKTIGKPGKLTINHWLTRCSDPYCNCSDREPSSYGGVKAYIKIYNCDTGEVLAEDLVGEHNVFSWELTTNRSLNVGERIQIYFDIRSAGTPPGPYRRAHVSYYYSIK